MYGGVLLIDTLCDGARDGVRCLSELSWCVCSVVATYFQCYYFILIMISARIFPLGKVRQTRINQYL